MGLVPPSRKNWILGWEIQLAIVAFEPLDELRLIFLDSQIVVPRLKQELALASSNTIVWGSQREGFGASGHSE